MKRFLLLISLISITGSVFAEPVTITPKEKISTTKKNFEIGNTYNFKDINSDEQYTGTVVYYRPNGFYGQEAQIEIDNFKNQKGERIPGKITIIPSNHKVFQESSKYFKLKNCEFIRGSEIILLPKKHTFVINNIKPAENGEEVIRISPKKPLSTIHDELEIGDKIEFTTINDVYKNGKLFIKSNTPITGTIDYLDENGWCSDSAAIYFKDFITKDIDGNIIKINSELKIDGFEILKYKSNRKAQFFNYISAPFRGKEIDIKPEDKNVNFNVIYKY